MRSVGTCWETSSHATCQGTFCHSRLSLLGHCGLIPCKRNGISVHELISTSKKKKKSSGREWMVKHSLKILPSNNNKKKPSPPGKQMPLSPPIKVEFVHMTRDSQGLPALGRPEQSMHSKQAVTVQANPLLVSAWQVFLLSYFVAFPSLLGTWWAFL